MCANWLFCTKFNSEQLLFEQFFDINGNFGSVQSKSESTFLFQYNIIFETYQSFEPSSSTPGETDMCTQHGTHWLFCIKFSAQQLLFEQFFNKIGNFGSIQPKSDSIFPFQYNIILGTYQSFEPSSFTPRGDRNVRPQTFLYEI